ncbi:MAG: ribosome assembly factor SBDS [Nanoarchaeota archaeon]|nr:ribosome assembly factor SBDS [Nanoarchaeota archaeon]MBU1004907.1 ribosome assembly factor SBDS [Nanoarchaeota archaeon]MBU1946557.1 ribosome assembly factor SBDS [Nanoarchaeota archaeon]
MTSVDEANIIRFKSHGHNFEIMADNAKALAVKSGANLDMKDVLAVQKVFTDSRKGMPASLNALKEAFGTDDPLEAAKIIIQKGDVPLTAEYKNNLKEQKKKQIINIIHQNAVDPKTHIPHPAQRIEAALDEAKFRVDEFKDVNQQIDDALKSIRPILPIKFETKEIAAKIPSLYAAKSYPIINSFGKKLREDWQTDGSLVVVVEIPGGLEEEFHSKLNALCHGDVETKILNIR